MPQAAGGVLALAILNGWLAARRGRSAARWALGSVLLGPLAWIMTLHLVFRVPMADGSAQEQSPTWPSVKVGGLALVVVLVVVAISNYAHGLPPAGAMP